MDFDEAFSPTRALNRGLEALRQAPGPLLLGGLGVWLTSGGCGAGPLSNLGAHPPLSPEALRALTAVAAGAAGLAFLGWLVYCWLLPGYLRLHREVLTTGAGTVTTLLSGSDAFVRMAGWRILSSLLLVGSMAAAALPGFVLMYLAGTHTLLASIGGALVTVLVVPTWLYVAAGLALGDRVVALEGRGPVDALERSWALARGHRVVLLFFFGVTGLVGFAGMLLCCVGVFVTEPIASVAGTEAFLKVAGEAEPAKER
jgi:hypothetical protein